MSAGRWRGVTQNIRLHGTTCLRMLTVVIVLACAGERGEREEDTDGLVSPEHAPVLMPEMPQILWADTLHRAETLAGLLADQGLTFPVVDRIGTVLGVVQDLKACKPGAVVTAYGQTRDEIERITYDRGEDIILISLDAQNEQPTVLTRNGLTRLAVVRGEVHANLYSSMIAAGAGAALVMAFADVFAWDIDFLTEVRQGDQFCVVFYEPVRSSSAGNGIQVEAASYRGMRGTRIAIRYAPCTGKSAYFDPQGRSLVRTFLRSPLNFKRISSGFSLSRMHPILRVPRPHLGVDYAAPEGDTGGERRGWYRYFHGLGCGLREVGSHPSCRIV